MLRYIIKRILWMIPVIIGVVAIVFLINALTPGDPAAQMLGNGATQEQLETLRRDLGLDKPLVVRFFNYLGGVVRGDLGHSYVSKEAVVAQIAKRFPTTFKLAVLSMIVAIVIGIPIGIISALRRYSAIDIAAMSLALVGVSAPHFWLALMAIMVFSVKLHWFPAVGLNSLKSWVLPVFCMCLSSLAQIARTTRSSVLEIMSQDYIRTARAKGQKESVVVFKHMLRNAIIPILTIIGMMFGMSLGGAVLVESVFAIPGLGKFLVDSIVSNDYPCIQGSVLYLSVLFSVVSLLVDLLYAAVDPRVKAQFKSGSAKRKKLKKAEA